MKMFSRILEAICRSRQLHAEEVLRRYSHLLHEAREYERRREYEQRQRLETAEAPPSTSPIRSTLPACVTACLAVAATALVNTTAMAADPTFATACALREIRVITTIEDHGAAQDIASDRLTDAGFRML
jgi:hypothetical protein